MSPPPAPGTASKRGVPSMQGGSRRGEVTPAAQRRPLVGPAVPPSLTSASAPTPRPEPLGSEPRSVLDKKQTAGECKALKKAPHQEIGKIKSCHP